MEDGVFIQYGVTIPEHELVIETSRAGGPGGQHVNKTESRVILRWNLSTTASLNDAQKERAMRYFKNRLTQAGELLIAVSEMRSQHQNRALAYERLAHELRKALQVPKKRVPTSISKSAKAQGIASKKHRATIKKLRSSRYDE